MGYHDKRIGAWANINCEGGADEGNAGEGDAETDVEGRVDGDKGNGDDHGDDGNGL